MRRKRGSGLLSTKCAVVTLLASVLCLIVIWSSLVYIYVAVSWDGIVQTWMAGSDQVLSVKDIVKEVGGLHLSESCFLPKATLKENLCAPQFIIAGTMKGGTTSLYTYLLNHPLVLPLENSSVNMTKGKDGKKIKISAMGDKEIRFFNSAVYRSISQQYSANNIVKGYMNFFPNISANSADEYSYMSGYITGEASPTYLAESGVATKIKNLFPAMKIIFLLRDPIDRAYSEYWFRQSYIVRSEREKFKFNSLGYSDEDIFLNCMEQDFQIMSYCGMDKWKISKSWLGSPEEICYRKTSKTMQSEQTNPPENNPVICGNATSPLSTYCLTKEFFGYCNQHSAMLGAYAVQLREWFDVFPDSLIKVIRSEDLYNDPIPVLKDVEKFLNIDRVDMNWSEITKNVYNMASPISLSGKDSQVVSSSSGGFVIAQASESSDYPPLSPSSRNYLTNKFKNYNKSLGSIIYQKFRLSWPSGKNQWNRAIQAQE